MGALVFTLALVGLAVLCATAGDWLMLAAPLIAVVVIGWMTLRVYLDAVSTKRSRTRRR